VPLCDVEAAESLCGRGEEKRGDGDEGGGDAGHGETSLWCGCGRPLLPRVALRGEEKVEDGGEHGECGERPEEAVRPEELELNVVRAEGDQGGEEDPP